MTFDSNFTIDSYTWYLFHSIVQQIDEKQYLHIYFSVLKHIYLICGSHKCNHCRKHSNDYFNKNIIDIQTKEEFIKFIFNFHNHVNLLSNKELFEFDNLEKYNHTSIPDIINNLNILFAKDTSVSTIKYIELFKFYNENTDYFTPLNISISKAVEHFN